VNNATGSFNPAQQILGSITVALTNKSDTSNTNKPKTITLMPDQILMGNTTLAELQPQATQSNLDYEVLTNTPQFSLVINKDQLPEASGTKAVADEYDATYTFTFVTETPNLTPVPVYTVSNATPVVVNADGAAINTAATTGIANKTQFSSLEKYQTAIATADIAVLAKLYAEAIENAEKKQAEGIAAAGGSPMLVMRFGILPQVAPIMLGHALYFLESNTRSASILGVVGAGGIGLQIAERIRVRNWDEVAFIIIMMVVMVMAIDWVSQRLRRRLIGGR
jgi:ABC-type amino acid transport system permease subunit